MEYGWDEAKRLANLRKHGIVFADIPAVFDGAILTVEDDRYQVLRAGWLKKSRVYGVLIHGDLKNRKAWIQSDGTEAGVANELLERGIPREDIVLAYHSPFMRQYNGFAVS